MAFTCLLVSTTSPRHLSSACAGSEDDPLPSGDVPELFLPLQSSHIGLDGGDDVAVSLDGGHVDHLDKVLDAVADGGEDKLGYTFLATPGVCDPGAIKFSFLSTPPQCTCSTLEDDAVVLLLLVACPVVVTFCGGDGDQTCFF